MKKILIVFLVLSVAACTFMLTASAADTPEQREATVVIPLHENIESGAIEFIYDESVLELVGGKWTLGNSLIDDFDLGKGRGVFALNAAGRVGNSIFTVKFNIKNTAAANENTTVDVTVKLMRGNGEIIVENVKLDIQSGSESTSGGETSSTMAQSGGTTASQTAGSSISVSTSASVSSLTPNRTSTDTDGIDAKVFYICSIAVAAVAIVAVVLILTKKNHN